MRAALVAVALAAVALAGSAAARDLHAAKAAAKPASAAAFKADEVLVQFQPGVDPAKEIPALLPGASPSKKLRASAADGDLVLVKLPPGQTVAAAKGAFDKGRDPDRATVRFVEENFRAYKIATTNDPDLLNGGLWGMTGAYGINAPAAWDSQTDCSAVYVGVIDEGIDYNHPDLAANIWTNAAEAAGTPGVDNDGNGYVDDVHGYDFYNNKGDVFTSTDGDAHGTHVSGTIGGVGNNGVGVAGVCWRVQLISAKFLGPTGGYLSGAVQAIDYLTKLKQSKGLNIVATSNSWGCGSNCYSQAIYDAINRANSAGILFIAAAGNEAVSTPSYPGAYNLPNVITVAALTSTGALASYSNRGTWVHLGAPGSSVKSTTPGNTYSIYSGTSMACPHVTGAAALYRAKYPAATAANVKTAILQSATYTPALAGSVTSSGGRLNAAGMLSIVPGVPPTCSCATNQYCVSGLCYTCPATCATCTSSTACTSCVSGYKGTTCGTRCYPSGTSVAKCNTCCSGACQSSKIKKCK